MRQILLAAAISALAALPAYGDVLSLRCTVTPASGAAYSGYVWTDMASLRAYERWYKPGIQGQPPIEGPFHALILPNELAVTNSASAKSTLVFRINRDSGKGNVSGGQVFCVSSEVPLPIKLPAPPPLAAPKH